MLRIKTRPWISDIEGMGLYAAENIKKGTVTWQYDVGFEPQFTQAQVDALPQKQRDFILTHGYYDYDKNVYILCIDNQQFINHSNDPKEVNITSTPDQDIAARDIKMGEELLCDYEEYEKDWFTRRGLRREDFK